MADVSTFKLKKIKQKIDMYFQENVENNVCDLRFRPELSVVILKKTLNSYLKTRYIVLKILID